MLWLAGLGLASAGDVPDVIEQVGEGVTVNWTTLTVEVSGQGRSSRVGRVNPVEELARREVDAALRQSIGRLRVAPDLSLNAVMSDDRIGASVRARAARWVVHEATYGTSGRVTLRASLELHDVLKPWLLKLARAAPVASADTATPPDVSHSGVLIDARGTRARPAYAPRIVSGSGEVLSGSVFDPVRAAAVAPARFLSDPAHPAAVGAVGRDPLILVVAGVEGAEFRLAPITVEELSEARLLLRQRPVVVLVDVP